MKCKEITEKFIGYDFRVYNKMAHFSYLDSIYERCMYIDLNNLDLQDTN